MAKKQEADRQRAIQRYLRGESPTSIYGSLGYSHRWFFKWLKVIPVRRDNPHASEAALAAGVQVLRNGGVVGIYPEGTRSPDGRLYRGKTGVARLALEAACPVIPVVVFGTRDLQPPGKRRPKLTGRVRIVYGKPLLFDRFEGMERDRFAVRSVTDEIMYEIMSLGGQEYVDEYAARVKALTRTKRGDSADRAGSTSRARPQ